MREELLKLTSELDLLRAEHESLQKENEYYKGDLLPTMREKNQEMQRKFLVFEAERRALAKENESMRQGSQSDSEQLAKLKQTHLEVLRKNETLEGQLQAL